MDKRFKSGVANHFVREGRLDFYKYEAGRTIVFIKHGAGHTIESHPKFHH